MNGVPVALPGDQVIRPLQRFVAFALSATTLLCVRTPYCVFGVYKVWESAVHLCGDRVRGLWSPRFTSVSCAESGGIRTIV